MKTLSTLLFFMLTLSSLAHADDGVAECKIGVSRNNESVWTLGTLYFQLPSEGNAAEHKYVSPQGFIFILKFANRGWLGSFVDGSSSITYKTAATDLSVDRIRDRNDITETYLTLKIKENGVELRANMNCALSPRD